MIATTLTLTLTWWWIPLAITIVAVLMALLHDDGGGFMSGIGNMLLLIPALFVSLIAWIVAALLK